MHQRFNNAFVIGIHRFVQKSSQPDEIRPVIFFLIGGFGIESKFLIFQWIRTQVVKTAKSKGTVKITTTIPIKLPTGESIIKHFQLCVLSKLWESGIGVVLVIFEKYHRSTCWSRHTT